MVLEPPAERMKDHETYDEEPDPQEDLEAALLSLEADVAGGGRK